MFGQPSLYFRRKGNGAAVYRLLSGQNARLDMQQIAVLKPSGEVKSQGKNKPTEAELAQIIAYHTEREAGRAARDGARVDALIGDMNATAQWLQADANDTQVNETAKTLLMAIHDLRTTLVKRMAGKSKGD